MNTTTIDYQLFVGIDRSDAKLDIACTDPQGRTEHLAKISTRPGALLEWVNALRAAHPDGQIAICIEQPCANIASFLGQFDYIDLFLVNPLLIRSYRDSFHTARPKDDVKDAGCIALFLTERYRKLKPWRPASAQMRQLRAYLEHRRSLVDQVTETTNRLTSTLKIYYPQALELAGERLSAPLACRFLAKFPDLETLQAAPPAELRAFYYANASRRKPVVEERVAAAAAAIPITTDEGLIAPGRELVLFLVKQLDLLRPQIRRYEQLIATIMAEHEDSQIFETLPGAGPNLSARLLATFGDDRSRFPTAESVQRLTGIAPVTKQSGKKRYVHRRFTKRTCPHFEHQTFIEWVSQTIITPGWARAYWKQQKAKKVGHWAIMRALAYKWIRILHRCWTDRVPYDEAKYVAALKRAGSPVAELVHKAA
jgi:transposase